MTNPRDDVQFQILEHLRVLREEMAAMHQRMERLEKRLSSDETILGLRNKS